MVFWDVTIFHVSMQDDKEAEHDLPLKNQIWNWDPESVKSRFSLIAKIGKVRTL